MLRHILLTLLVTVFLQPALAADAPRNPRLKVAWAAADARPAPFDRVLLAPVELEFRDVKPLRTGDLAGSSRTVFPIGERDRERLARNFNEIFREELAENEQFKLVETAGPGVLVVKPVLRDIVWRVPPEEPPGRSTSYVDSVGDFTLVVDFADGATGRQLGTATDRRSAEPFGSAGGFGEVRANSVGASVETRRLARSWANSLERRLMQLYYEAKPR
jgi:hypothetical protein